MGLITSFISAV